jgi:hypothetical protein
VKVLLVAVIVFVQVVKVLVEAAVRMLIEPGKCL